MFLLYPQLWKGCTNMEFKDRLRALRQENKMTQSKLAEKLDYGYTAIANYESGKNQPSISILIQISKIFGVSLDYLLGVSNIRYPYPTDNDPSFLLEIQKYYPILSTQSKEELLEYAQWLIHRQEISDTERKRKGPTLVAAQKTAPYHMDE